MHDDLLDRQASELFTPIPKLTPSPDRTALVTIDVQYYDAHPDHGYGRRASTSGAFDLLKPYYDAVGNAIDNVQRLQAAARELGIELIHVGAGPLTSNSREMHPLIQDRFEGSRSDLHEFDFLPDTAPQGDELALRKITSSAFPSTPLELVLRNMGLDTLVICGLVTNGCVESTVRGARDLGFRVLVASDACATWTPDLHEYALKYIAMSYGRVETTAEIIDAMRAAGGRPTFQAAPSGTAG